MSEWQETPLSQLVTFQKGRKVDTSSYSQAGYARYLGASGIQGHSDGFAETKFAVVAKEVDILMLWDGERSGLVGCGQSGVVASTVCRLSPTEGIHPKFLYFALAHNFTWIQNRRTGSGVPHVPKELGRILRVRHPKSRSVQKRIAAILTGLDAAIEKTEALIEKHHQIKAGLMHDLFTRGVLPNGQLRPPREQAPEMYRETVIGPRPVEWGIRRCTDLCSRICVGIVIQPAQYYVVAGVPALRSANVREGRVDWANLVYISPVANSLLAKSQIRAADILSVRTGYPGTSAVVPEELGGANCIDVLISTPGPEVDSDFLCYWINSTFGRGQVLQRQGGLAQQHFNVGEMRDLLVVVPTLSEQVQMRDRMQSIDCQMKSESAKLEKWRAMKLGLTQDLLTGKVPVKVAANGVPA